MKTSIPSAAMLRESLLRLNYPQVQALCAACDVPITTAWKIRMADTADPKLETARKLWPMLQRMARRKA